MILGISPDKPSAQKKFKEKEELPYTLLADADKEVAHKFDVIKEKNMYGKKYMGIERSTFIIDKKGKIAKSWRKVSVTDHAKEVQDTVSKLK